MTTRPFKLVNRSESQRLCERVSGAAAHWAQDWLSAGLTAPKVAVRPAAEPLPACTWTARRIGTESVAIGVTAGDTSLRSGLVGTAEQSSLDLDDPLLGELERKAVQALLDALIESGNRADVDMPSSQEIQAPGSGYAALHCRWSETLEIHLVLWPQTVQAWLGQSTVKTTQRVSVSRIDVLDSQTVKLEVVAGEADIAFDELRSLSEGVVIKLDRRLDQPLQLRLLGDGAVCAGHLGVREDRRAIQIVAVT
ncbi:MAG TPA: FliM/FliN family flagellar motor C-terminal domain-containing protein [Burkholderiales bacterium]|nr:FliM/FliN family flagellar motor C-terminal domain-containing protein [Burkholderiales bacterium]